MPILEIILIVLIVLLLLRGRIPESGQVIDILLVVLVVILIIFLLKGNVFAAIVAAVVPFIQAISNG